MYNCNDRGSILLWFVDNHSERVMSPSRQFCFFSLALDHFLLSTLKSSLYSFTYYGPNYKPYHSLFNDSFSTEGLSIKTLPRILWKSDIFPLTPVGKAMQVAFSRLREVLVLAQKERNAILQNIKVIYGPFLICWKSPLVQRGIYSHTWEWNIENGLLSLSDVDCHVSFLPRGKEWGNWSPWRKHPNLWSKRYLGCNSMHTIWDHAPLNTITYFWVSMPRLTPLSFEFLRYMGHKVIFLCLCTLTANRKFTMPTCPIIEGMKIYFSH